MGWRFRKSFKIFPGLRWNLGRRGSSLSFGQKGFTVNVSKRGTRTTVGIPGTGLSYSTSTKAQKTQRIQPPPPVPTTSMVKKKSGLWFYIVGGVLLGIWFISHLADTGNSQVSPPSSRATPYQTPAPAPIVQPTPEATPLARFTPSPTLASPAPTPFIVRPAEMVATYRVIGIRQGDFLNLREGPGESYTIVQKLPNGLNGIKLVGASIDNGGTTWQKVDSRGVQGWAAMDYLIIDKVVQVRAAVPVGTQSTRENNPPSDDYVPKEVRLTSSVAFPVVEHGFQTGLTTPPVGTKVKLVKIVGYNVVLEYQGQQKSVSASSTDLLQRMLGTADD